MMNELLFTSITFSSFITYRSCKHLDGKHTVFGRVVGGLDTLAALERVDTDNKDVPIEKLMIERAVVFVDPFTEVDEQLAKEREEEMAKNKVETVDVAQEKKKKEEKKILKAYSSGVGKFIPPSVKKEARKAANEKEDEVPEAKKKKKSNSRGFSDFSAW